MGADLADVQRLISHFQLIPHPEGGHYRETYRSKQKVARLLSDNERSASTAIYYLLSQGAYSAWHKIASDEVWHFYSGSPLNVHVLSENGQVITHTLGNPFAAAGATFQAVVPAECWFAAELADPNSNNYALIGCTVAPGFEFSEFQLASADLLRQYPEHAEWMTRLLSKTSATC